LRYDDVATERDRLLSIDALDRSVGRSDTGSSRSVGRYSMRLRQLAADVDLTRSSTRRLRQRFTRASISLILAPRSQLALSDSIAPPLQTAFCSALTFPSRRFCSWYCNARSVSQLCSANFLHSFVTCVDGDAENAGLENAGPDLQGWKMRDNRLWNAKCLLMHKMQFQRTSQNTYCTLQSINKSIKCN